MKLRWPHGLATVALLIGAIAAVVFCILEFGIAQRWARDFLVHELEARTGARVELGGFHLHVWRLHAELDNLTLHGRETSSEAPLFHADRVQAGITVLSFLHRQFKIDELLADRPQLNVRYEKNGSSNLPVRKFSQAPVRGRTHCSICASARWNCAMAARTSTTAKFPWRSRGRILRFYCST